MQKPTTISHISANSQDDNYYKGFCPISIAEAKKYLEKRKELLKCELSDGKVLEIFPVKCLETNRDEYILPDEAFDERYAKWYVWKYTD